MNNPDVAIKLEQVHYAYRSNWLLKRIPSIENVTLDIFKGEIFGFLGHNGAGKTTTIKCILNLVTPQQGSIFIFDKKSTDHRSRNLVGYLPEQPYFYDHLSVYEIMDLYAALNGLNARERKPAIDKALALVRMDQRKKSKMRSLSKGLTQRIAMAQAIVAEPKLLILDEPFSGLDPLGRKEFADLLRSLKESGTTIFMSSHVLSDVEQLCSRVSIMREGKIEGVFSLDEVCLSSSGHFELVITLPDEELLDCLPKANETVSSERLLRLHYPDKKDAHNALEICVSKNVNIVSFSFQHEGLEELFVRLVSNSAENA